MKRKGMQIALVGYGRMGREVEEILLERGHQVAVRIDPQGGPGVTEELSLANLKGVDGVIEFSLPAGVVKNAKLYSQAGVPAVVGTTGWEADRDTVRKIVESSQIGFVYGSNYSVGAHLFYRLTAVAATLLNAVDDYDIMVHEYHHNKKADSPSGTALSLAGVILENLGRKKTIQTQALDRPIKPEELHVTSTRGGNIPGIHTVRLDGGADSITLTHDARSRQGFARGAVLAMEWIRDKKGFHAVDEFIEGLLGGISGKPAAKKS